MASIRDLPKEIIALIITHLIRSPLRWVFESHRDAIAAKTAAQLRLVCRKWAACLYEDHLYRTLRFKSASRSVAFINYFRGRSQLLPRPRCQRLIIHRIWTEKPRSRDSRLDIITSPIMDSLIELFTDTIVTLDLRFVDFMNLPMQTIHCIQRAERLQNLHLRLLRSTYEELLVPNPDCFNSLVVGIKNLKSLFLALPLSLPRRFGFSSGIQYPAITHLHIDLAAQTPGVILSLAIALKSSLRVLSLHANRSYDTGLVLPLYETLRETLEGLAVTTESLLAPILDFKFPKLKTITVQCLYNSVANLFSQDIFVHAPIQVIALNSRSACWSKLTFKQDPFTNLRNLQKMVFLATDGDYSPLPQFLAACEAHHIKCEYLDHSDVFLVMMRDHGCR
ncbi:hypothetical protein PGT21_027524 [Puccinia graminis f. sp. tritici]|uniref:Uncharacterized protein n=1 Tax=Puccinia graminis f. sp. tritici TaxID=56615 RepID=A0A5B0N7F1_PUCGR|nr:hypothetical protein PGT21_027524 [Puccinia graminis f. sp. tritici]KAA1132966.1 hypothetical protein PGTUg99_014475 [Puccinia graminis f. sp. tritici]